MSLPICVNGLPCDLKDLGLETLLKMLIHVDDDGCIYIRTKPTGSTGSGGGIVELNGLTGDEQTFENGTDGNDFNIISSGSTHTFNLPDASDVARGVVTTGDQTFAGIKSTTIWNATEQFNIGGNFFADMDDVSNIRIVGGQALTGGKRNIFIGDSAGASLENDNNNVFIGFHAGLLNNGGGDNTFIGSNAGQDNTIGISNVYIGVLAGGGEDGNDNVAIGNAAGVDSTSGSNNVFVGRASGAAIDTGSNNVFIGINTGGDKGNISKSVAIGQGAIADKDNQFVFGASTPGNTIADWKINGIDYVMPSAQGAGALMNDGSGNLVWTAVSTGQANTPRTYTSVTLAAFTPRTPSATNDVEVIVSYECTSVGFSTADVFIEVDNGGDNNFVIIGVGGLNNNFATPNLVNRGSITFTCPPGSQYRWTHGGGTVTSIFELIK